MLRSANGIGYVQGNSTKMAKPKEGSMWSDNTNWKVHNVEWRRLCRGNKAWESVLVTSKWDGVGTYHDI